MADAGLTNGAFYAHFPSKDAWSPPRSPTSSANSAKASARCAGRAGVEHSCVNTSRSSTVTTPPTAARPRRCSTRSAAAPTRPGSYTDGLLPSSRRRRPPGATRSPRGTREALSLFSLMIGTMQLSRALADRQLADAVLDRASRTPWRCWAPGNSADTPHHQTVTRRADDAIWPPVSLVILSVSLAGPAPSDDPDLADLWRPGGARTAPALGAAARAAAVNHPPQPQDDPLPSIATRRAAPGNRAEARWLTPVPAGRGASLPDRLAERERRARESHRWPADTEVVHAARRRSWPPGRWARRNKT